MRAAGRARLVSMDRKFVDRVSRAFESRHESEQAAKADRRSGARDAIAWRMLALSDEGLAHLAIAADTRLRADARGGDSGVREELAAGLVLRSGLSAFGGKPDIEPTSPNDRV